MTPNELALFGYARSTFMLTGMTADLSPSDWLHAAVPGSNCAAWIVGHLIVVEHWAASMLSDTLPFAVDDTFKSVYGKGSQPTRDTNYGDVTKLMPMWSLQRARMVELVTALPPSDFSRPIDHPTFKQLGQLISLIPVHTTLHCGQLSTIRRSLGKPPLL